MSELQPGDPERLGSYVLTGRLGEGGQGVVYDGTAPDGTRVAVKLLRPDLTEDADARNRFVREAQSAKRVARFCTAQVLEADVAGDRPYIVSEYVPGPSLQRQVAEEGPRTGAALERLAIGTVTALVAIHQAEIVHRDFKPHNVLIGPDGPRVIDFGIARALDASSTSATATIGTPAYMAPEQVMGERITAAVDIFAWGSVMAFAATGISPFGQDTIPAVINRILNQEPDLSGMPQQLRALVGECLAKDPALRPTASDLLMRLLGQESGATPPAASTMPVGIPGTPGGANETRLETIPGADEDVPTAVLGQGAVLAGGHTRPGQAAGGSHPADQFTLPPVPGYAPAAAGRSGGGSAIGIAAAVLALVVAVVIGVTAWMAGSSDKTVRNDPTPGTSELSTEEATTPDDDVPTTRMTDRPIPRQSHPATSRPSRPTLTPTPSTPASPPIGPPGSPAPGGSPEPDSGGGQSGGDSGTGGGGGGGQGGGGAPTAPVDGQ